MKIYLAGRRSIARPPVQGAAGRWWQNAMLQAVKRRLYSYHYLHFVNKGDSADARYMFDHGCDLFLDSGAFSAFTKQIVLDVHEYARFVLRCQEHKYFTVISSLDDTAKNAQQSYDWLKALEAHGCRVQPVYHTREDPAWLKRYVDEGYEYIFVGGMVTESTTWLRDWLDGIWAEYLTNADGSAKVRVHGFGLTDMQLMFRYPWASVDSSTWLMTGNFGGCMFRIGNTVRKVVMSEDSPAARKFRGWHYNVLSKAEQRQVDEWLAPHGVTAQQCGEHFSFREVVNAATFQGLEDMGTTHFKRQQEGLFS